MLYFAVTSITTSLATLKVGQSPESYLRLDYGVYRDVASTFSGEKVICAQRARQTTLSLNFPGHPKNLEATIVLAGHAVPLTRSTAETMLEAFISRLGLQRRAPSTYTYKDGLETLTLTCTSSLSQASIDRLNAWLLDWHPRQSDDGLFPETIGEP